MMKPLISLTLIIVCALNLSYGQVTLKSDLTGTAGNSVSTSAFPDSFRTMTGQTGTASCMFSVGGTGAGTSMEALNTLGTDTYGWAFWNKIQTVDTSTVAIVFAQRPGTPAQGAGLHDIFFGYSSDSALSSNKWGIQLTYRTATTSYLDLGRWIGSTQTFENQISTFITWNGLTDTIKFQMMRDSMQVFQNSTFIIGRTYAGFGHYTEKAGQFPFFRMKVRSSNTLNARVDKFFIGRYPFAGLAPTAPPAADASAPTGYAEAFTTTGSTLWDTSKTGYFKATVNDTFAIRIIRIDTANVSGTFARFDTVVTYTRPGLKDTTFISKTIQFRAPRTVQYRVFAQDSAGNGAYVDTNTVTIGTASTKWRTLYLPDWNLGQNMTLANQDFTGCTHVIHFGIDFSSTTPFFHPEAGSSKIAREQTQLIARVHAEGKKVLLGLIDIGGSIANGVIASNANTETLTDSVTKYCQRLGYDGVDIDIEYPSNANNFDSLLTKMRRKFNNLGMTSALITFAAYQPLGSGYASGAAQITRIAGLVDQINLMTYSSGTGTYGGYNTAEERGNCAFNGGSWSAWVYGGTSSVSYGPQRVINNGWPRAKIGLGVPIYGQDFYGTTQYGPCIPLSGSSNAEVNMTTIFAAIAAGAQKITDTIAHYNYIQYTSGTVKHYVSFHDSLSMRRMAFWVDSMNIGGIMVWEPSKGYEPTQPTVALKNRTLNWAYTAMGSIGTSVAVPPIPVNVLPANASTGIDPTTIILKARRSSGATLYGVQLSTSPTFSTLLINETGRVDTFRTVSRNELGTSSVGNTTFYYRWNAGNGSGYSSFSTAFSFTTKADSATTTIPVLVSPSANATSQPVTDTLKWNVCVGATSYFLQYAAGDSNGTAQGVGGIIDTSYILSGLSNSTPYFWRVQAVVAGGINSDTSAWRKFTTVSASFPPASTPSTRREHRAVTSVPVRGGYATTTALVPYQTQAALASYAMLDSVSTSGNVSYGFLGTPPHLIVRDYTGQAYDLSAIPLPTESNDFTVHTSLVSEINTTLNAVDINGTLDVNSQMTVVGVSYFLNNVTFSDTVGMNALLALSGGLATTSTSVVTNLNADRVDSYNTSTTGSGSVIPVTVSGKLDSSFIPAPDNSMIRNNNMQEEFIHVGSTSAQGTVATVRALGQYGWTIQSIIGTTATVNPIRGWGQQQIALPADSGRNSVIYMQADSSLLPSNGRGGWFSFIGTDQGRGLLVPALPTGATINMGVGSSASVDSFVIVAGLTGIRTGTGQTFRMNDTTVAGIWFEFGNKAVNGADSIYAVTCNGTTKTKQGIVAQVANTWYRLTMNVTASSVTFTVRSGVGMGTSASRVITTTLPGATLGATPVLGCWSYAADNPTSVLKIARFDYYEILRGGIR